MRLKLIGFALLVLISLPFIPFSEAKEVGYFRQLTRTFSRGVVNMITSPWEIPYTIRQHDLKNDGNPRIFRDIAGFFDGVFRTVTRLGCGFWDVAFSVVPGDQEGLPLKPKTFF